ncbi:Hypothetical protein NTJ_15392 [Nesidiocoris tenuis]|uniref:Peptidase S1 domain-containing protein n=2 Tax=Nesidiocoris tenuis TaxID=355587 RepID=A0ABN7BE35_9HEMI|nr:Hypothetical protein NTJ_15392 [Nesidiocoris tenuis]
MAVQISVKLLFLFGFVVIVSGNSDSKVVSGLRARVIPYMVSVQKHKKHKCGGSLLTLSHVLLACHCFSGYDSNHKPINESDPEFFRVFAGHNDLETKSEFRQTRRVESFLRHPKCRWRGGYDIPKFDLALIVTKSAFKTSANVVPIALYSMSRKPYEELIANVTEDTSCWSAGWGYTSKIGVRSSRYLNYLDMRVVPYSKCKALLVPIDDRFKTMDMAKKGQICAKGVFKGDTVHKGDSGGPLICRGKLIAVTSYLLDPEEDIPAVFAKVSEFVEWYGGIAQRSMTSSGRSRQIGLVFLVMINLIDIGMR